MSNYDYKPFYRRNLPHIQPQGKALFITFRLADSIPMAVLEKLRTQAETEAREGNLPGTPELQQRQQFDNRKRAFGRWDHALDNSTTGPKWLADKRIAAMLQDAIFHRHPAAYDLDVFCIMPNHVHMIFTPANNEHGQPIALQTIMHSLKRFTATQANRILERKGQFWHHENYDHFIRGEDEWHRIVRYVLDNPVKAGLAKEWTDWEWSYWRGM